MIADLARPIADLDGRGILSDFQASGLLAGGRGHLISLAAIREALGPRWPSRKVLVWDMTEAQVRRRIGERGFMARLDDETFLILTPELESGPAKVLAVRILREIVSYFLGDAKVEFQGIRVATRFEDGQLDCRPLSLEELALAIETDRANREPASFGVDNGSASSEAEGGEPAGEFTTLEGRRLRFSVSVDPVVDLTRFVVIGHRIEPKITFEDSRRPLSLSTRRQLLPRDLLGVDMATIQRGLARLKSGQNSSVRPSLILTISFQTLSNTRSRAQLMAEVAKARKAVAKSVIFEITDFNEGLPGGRLQDSAALLKPFCRSVFAHAETSMDLIGSARALGLSGLVFEPPPSLNREDGQEIWLLAMTRSFAACTGIRIAANLSSKDLLPLACAAGLTHATVRA